MNWNVLKKIVGALLIVLGLLAFFTPLTPGAWLVFVGAEILGIRMLSRDRLTEQYQRFKDWRSGKGALTTTEQQDTKQ